MYPDEPALTDDCLGTCDDEIQRAVEPAHGHAAAIETWQPSMLSCMCLQAFAQFLQSWRPGLKFVECSAPDPFQGSFACMGQSSEKPLLQIAGAVDLLHGADGIA